MPVADVQRNGLACPDGSEVWPTPTIVEPSRDAARAALPLRPGSPPSVTRPSAKVQRYASSPTPGLGSVPTTVDPSPDTSETFVITCPIPWNKGAATADEAAM